MMNTPMSMALGHPVNDLSHEKICIWLKRALHGEEPLPLLTSDEHPHLGLLRLEKTLWPTTRRSISDGCLELIRQFSADGLGDDAYLQELLFLTAGFKNPEAVQILAQLARRFLKMPQISVEIRIAVLAALVDTPPPQSVAFWHEILKQDSEKYAGLALSGVLATNPAQAINMLPAMPDAERAGQAAALKLDLAWDDIDPKQRFQLVREVEAILRRCGSRFARPVAAWTASKRMATGWPRAITVNSNPGLAAGLKLILGIDVAPRAHTPKLCRDSPDDGVGEFYNLPQKPAHQSSAPA